MVKSCQISLHKGVVVTGHTCIKSLLYLP